MVGEEVISVTRKDLGNHRKPESQEPVYKL
jgi:hypothetical protein